METELGEFEISEQQKELIDKMSHREMCSTWRFAKSGHPLLSGDAGNYFKERLFTHFGGFTPEISKEIGWS